MSGRLLAAVRLGERQKGGSERVIEPQQLNGGKVGRSHRLSMSALASRMTFSGREKGHGGSLLGNILRPVAGVLSFVSHSRRAISVRIPPRLFCSTPRISMDRYRFAHESRPDRINTRRRISGQGDCEECRDRWPYTGLIATRFATRPWK